MARRRTGAAIATAAALALTTTGCGSDGEGEGDGTPTAGTSSSGNSSSSPASGSDSSSSSSPSSPEWDKDHALAQAKKALETQDGHDVNKPLKEDVEWATDTYVRGYNKELKKFTDVGVTQKGSITTTSVHLRELNPDAIGGPDLTVTACSTSTVRYYGPKGKDITGHPKTGEPVPKKPQKSAHLVSLTTTDHGKTWQIAKTQQLFGKTAKETPCDVTL